MTENTKEQAKGLIERQVQKSVIEETTKILMFSPKRLRSFLIRPYRLKRDMR